MRVNLWGESGREAALLFFAVILSGVYGLARNKVRQSHTRVCSCRTLLRRRCKPILKMNSGEMGIMGMSSCADDSGRSKRTGSSMRQESY